MTQVADPVPKTVVDEAIKVIQDHLNQEAGNRQKASLQPSELCPMQKAALVDELARVIGN